MEEQKSENKEELQQETAEGKNSGQGNPSTRSSLLWIFAGGYLVYTGYRLCASVISGARFWCGISGSGRYFCCDRSSASDHGNP